MTDTEPIPADFEQLSPWFSIIRHANRTIMRGPAQWLVIVAYIDEYGRPRLHGEIDVLKRETCQTEQILIK